VEDAAVSALDDVQKTLADVRARKAAVERELRSADARGRSAASRRVALDRSNDARRPSLHAAERTRLAGIERDSKTNATRLAREKATLVAAESSALAALAALGDPRTVLGHLDDDVPFVLFPLRLETRFMKRGSKHELWVRIYPDDCQVQTYTDFITDAELSSTRRFWIDYWKAGGFVDQERAAWRGLVSAHGSGRAALLIERIEPAGVKPTKAKAEDVILVVAQSTGAPGGALTAAELAAATAFWIAYWRAGMDATARDAARATLVSAVGAANADRIVADFRPGNLADEPLAPHARSAVTVSLVTIDLSSTDTLATTATSWQGAPRATTLPDRFVVTGVNDGKTVFEVVGKPVPSTLPVGPDPTLPEAEQIKSANGELVLNEDLRWLTDFDEAVERGMGVKVPLDAAQFAAGFDRLFVLGVRLSSNAENGADLLESLIRDHHASKSGFALLPQGTPTNNTEGTPSGYSWIDDPDASFERVFGTASGFPITNDAKKKHDGQWLAEALGIDVEVLRPIAHADGLDQANARAMNTALWPTTWGYFLDAMLGDQLDDATIEKVRTFFVRYVSGRGALPAIRIGKQPYGILPATVHSRLDFYTGPTSSPIPFDPQIGTATQPVRPATGPGTVGHVVTTGGAGAVVSQGPAIQAIDPWPWDFLFALQKRIRMVDEDFRTALPKVPRVGKGSDPQATLLDVIGLHPASVEFYQRFVQSAEQYLNHAVLEAGPFAALIVGALHEVRKQTLAALGLDPNDELPILDKFLNDKAVPMFGAVIDDAPLSETTPIRAYAKDGKNYLEWLAHSTFDTIRKENFGGKPRPRALLYLMARHAVLMSYWDASVRLFEAAGLVTGRSARREADFLQVGAAVNGTSKYHYLAQKDLRVTGGKDVAVAQYLDTPAIYRTTPAARRLREVKDALASLENLSTAALERLFAEHVDVCNYRLDAWKQGLVHHQLAEQRSKKKRGAYLGAFGWVEKLRPDDKTFKAAKIPTDLEAVFDPPDRLSAPPRPPARIHPPIVSDPSNGGYVHAPSINHATTAAILRNAYLTNATKSDPGPMSVNLSSRRVRVGKQITDGIARGQGLPELLGYRFERGLHDRHSIDGAELEKFMLSLRAKFPLVANKHKATRAPQASIEKLEARNVVDGLKLVEHVRKSGKRQFPFGFPAADFPPFTAADRKAIDDEVEKLEDAADAVADLMLAESVHRVVQGQAEAGKTALDVIGKGARPHEVEVARTPRSGLGLVHRVAIHLDSSATGGTTPRSTAEPALDAWLTKRLPPLAEISCRALVRDPTEAEPIAAIVTAADLGLSATDVLHLFVFDGREGSSDLDDRIERRLRATIARHPGAQIEIRYTDRLPGKVTFFEAGALVRHLRRLVLESRALSATEVARANEAGGDPRFDLGELRVRVEAAIASLTQLDAALATLASDTSSGPEPYLAALSTVLAKAALHGIPESGTGALHGELRALHDRVARKLERVIARWEEHVVDYDAILAGLASLDDERLELAALSRAEALVSTSETNPVPATVASYGAIVASKRAAFDGALSTLRAAAATPVTSVRAYFDLVASAIAAIGAQDAMSFDPDRKSNDLAPEETALAKVRETIAARVLTTRALLSKRIASAHALVTEARSNADPLAAAKLLRDAAKQALGDAALVVPRFTLTPDPGAELRNAVAASATLLGDLQARAFPVDDWLYGAARVREKLGHLVKATSLAEAFGRPGIDLVPAQLPFRADDRWAALELPPTYELDGEKLLYSASFETPFDDTRTQCGLVLDEWTEIVPGKEEVTGIAFHFDQPNNEPPQAILLVSPPKIGGRWKWKDLFDTLDETLHEAKMRAIEPEQIKGSLYAQFLPATLLVVTASLITLSTNFADNNA
jgi:hypothetical protein